jgi:ParB-like nuclease domain
MSIPITPEHSNTPMDRPVPPVTPSERLAMPARLSIALWAIKPLLPYRLPLRKNDHAVDRMVASISEFGFRIPLLVSAAGEIIDGHLRLKAAQKLGFTEVPVIVCDDWAPQQIRAFRLMANRPPGPTGIWTQLRANSRNSTSKVSISR